MDGPYEFVQLSWADVDEGLHGKVELVTIDPTAIGPQQLDPSVNLVPLLEEKGGRILSLTWIGWGPASGRDEAMFDGDLDTAFLGDGDWGGDYGVIQQKSLVFDLGGSFLIDRVRFFPRQRHLESRFIETYKIGVSDGDPLKKGTRQFERGIRGSFFDVDLVYDVVENNQADNELKLPLVPVRHLLFEAPENTRGIWELAEFEIYGTGFAPEAEYITNVIDLGAPAALGQLQWVGQEQPGADIDLSMRSGLDDDPNTYWRFTFRGDERTRFDERGRALNLASYGKLGRGEQGGVTHDTESWDFWGTPYDFAASSGAMSGSRPQQFVQLKADFTSTQAAAGGQLNYVQFSASIPPVASQALAEITPVVARAGEVTSFTYCLRPRLFPDDLGFDSLAIDTPARAEGVDAVRISEQEVAFEVVELNDNGLVVRIPRIDSQRTEELIEVQFRSQVFKFGTVFSGRIFDSTRPDEVQQGVTPGDADPLEDGNRLSVDLANFADKTIQALRLNTPVFTPNGDGANDRVQIEYELLNLDEGVQVQVEIFDLSGRSLGAVYQGQASSGEFSAFWNGRLGLDGTGQLVPPGLYIVRLEVDADQAKDVQERVVSLVY
ncbi:MAG: hypothetical protein GKR89_29950 [Candidatus Latescibacteria bacterium]|nr:hypothetical protein [Candidatus Latescibacterota bacterium]